MKKKFIGQITITTMLLILLTGNAYAGCVCVATGTDYGCGDTVTESCVFDGDLTCPAGHGLIIGADGVTIDGAGFKITGSETADACEWVGETDPEAGYCGILNIGYDNVKIKNLEIENFCTGIAFSGEGRNPVVNSIIDNCEIHDNGNASCSTDTSIHGIHLCYASECTIANNRIHDNTGAGESCRAGGNGIFLYAGSHKHNIIAKNEIYENRKGGFLAKRGFEHSEIINNQVYGNGQGGIILRCKTSNFNTIEGNNASANFGDGIFIGGENNTVMNNVACGNMAGFRISSGDVVGDGDGIDMGRGLESKNNAITSNEVCGNEGTDIEVAVGCVGNHGRDNTCDTTKNYNDEGAARCTYSCGGEEAVTEPPTSVPTTRETPASTPGFAAAFAVGTLAIYVVLKRDR